jgi:hypothetical protein
MWEWRYSSTLLDIGTRRRWVVNFPKGKSLRYPRDRRPRGPQSRSGRCGEEKILAPAGTRTPAVQPASRRYMTELSRLEVWDLTSHQADRQISPVGSITVTESFQDTRNEIKGHSDTLSETEWCSQGVKAVVKLRLIRLCYRPLHRSRSSPNQNNVCRAYKHTLSLWLYSPFDLDRFFNFLILHIFDSTPWRGDQPIARPLSTQNNRTQTSMPWVGLEPTIPVFKRAKTVHVLDRAATVISI